MSYKTILVHADGGSRAAVRLQFALDLAARSNAHVVGLHAISVPRMPAYAMVEGGDSMREYQAKAAADLAARAQAEFERVTAASGYPSVEWRESRGDAAEVMPVHARYADLLVLGQGHAEDGSGVEPDFVDRVLLGAGRPALVIPYAGRFTAIGNRVLVAWNASREATRAVTDALPLLQHAAEVTVIAFNPDDAPHGDVPGADIALFLARHGVKVSVSQERGTDIDAGSLLLSRAADLDANLMVMGAYGRSRMQELILGGATRTILQSMTMPVLMSH
jgi:nucleotide-binding universal stress UspA family protein